jgi:hypothetical protein
MRTLVVVGLVAACGSEPGLLLDVGPGTTGVAQVEVFLPKDTAGDGMAPPMNAAKLPGTIYTVVDSVAGMIDSSGRVRILLQPGDVSDVPALLVLGYDGNHTPIASAVITDPSGSIHLPRTQAVEVKVDLIPSMYVPPSAAAQPSNGVRIARWSPTGADLDGACIAVLQAGTNTFFSPTDDLDCDNATPECDDTFYRYVSPAGALPINRTCASQSIEAMTQDACVLGTTVGCTDGVGTCGPVTGTDQPKCVPVTLCESCPNSDAITGTSGIDLACEAAALADSKTLRIDCKLAVTQPSAGAIVPCVGSGAVDLASYVDPAWACSQAGPLDFVGEFGLATPLSYLGIGGTSTAPDYQFGVHCNSSARLLFSMTSTNQTPPPLTSSADTRSIVAFGMVDKNTGTAATLIVPFRLSYDLQGDTCPTGSPISCTVVQDSGDPKDDPIWHCAGG